MMTADELRARGLLTGHRAVASVAESFGLPGTPSPERLLTARLFNSVEFEVLPGRGFDIGSAWFRGVPISWFSPVVDARALPSPSGREWLTRFTGGLLTTCGLHHIGAPDEQHGMHGSVSHLPADEVSWRIGRDVPGAQVTLSGTVEDAALFDASFRLEREITAISDVDGAAVLRIVDHVTNIGPKPAALHLLYHLNLGAPLVAPGSTVVIDGARTTASGPHPEVPDWRTLPEAVAHVTEAVFRHDGVTMDADGLARATVTDPAGTLAATIAWSAATLPHLHQWVFPTRGRWALAVEPSTVPLFGSTAGDGGGDAPILEPGERRRHEVRVTISTQSPA